MTEEYKNTVDALLKRHYGVGISHTSLDDGETINYYIESGARPFEAINDHVSRNSLGRIDRPLVDEDLSREHLVAEDEDALGEHASPVRHATLRTR